MTSVPVLLNRGGGTVSANPKIGEEVASAFRAAGIDVDVDFIDGADCASKCRELVERGERLIIVGGGDGSLSAAASALAGTDSVLGILPLGTLNHFARDLQVPDKLEDAAKLIAANSVREVDIAQMNDRTFINNSAIGLYPLMVLDRDTQRRQLGRNKGVAMIVASMRTLLRFGHQRLTLTVNDEKAKIDTPLLFVGNNEYSLDIASPGKRDSIQGGILSVFVMRKKTRRGFVAASVRALFNRSREDDLVRLDHVDRLQVGSQRPELAVSLDGEVARVRPPLEYRIRKKALHVIAP